MNNNKLQSNDLLYSPGNRFIEPKKVLVSAGLKPGMIVGDFGSGSGYYSTAAAEIIGNKGKIYAVDIQEEPLKNLMADARLKNLRNIETLRCDLEKEDICPVPSVSCDLVVLANILHHVEDKKAVVAAAYKAIKTGGAAIIVEWEPGGAVFGPPAKVRLSEQQVSELFTTNGFKPGRKIYTDPYHYAVTYIK